VGVIWKWNHSFSRLAFNPADIGTERALFGSLLLRFYSWRETTHGLGENIEKCLIELDLRPSSRGPERNIFSVSLPTLCLNGDGLEGGGSVSG
jgi:hypothetical protein